MELTILFGCLKLLWIGFSLWKQYESRKREKALVEEVENLNQRLFKLESEVKKLNP